jgi:ABC-2 type transport system permease protein
VKRLLRIESIKVFSSTAFWVLLPIHAALFILIVVAASNLFLATSAVVDTSAFFSFPGIWNTYAWIASFFNVLFAILIIIFTGSEFIWKTWRQHIIDGLERSELFFSKLLLIAFLSIYAFVVVFLVTMVAGLIMSDTVSSSTFFENSWYLLILMFQALCYMSMAFFIVVLIRNIALSIVTFVLYRFTFEPLISAFFPDYIDRFFPMEVISNLTPMPGGDMIHIQSTQSYNVNGNPYMMDPAPVINYDLPLWVNLILAAVYVCLFLGSAWWMIRRRNF